MFLFLYTAFLTVYKYRHIYNLLKKIKLLRLNMGDHFRSLSLPRLAFLGWVGEETCGRSPHISCKRDQIKMRDCVDRRVTHQSGLPHLPGVPRLHVNRP